MIGARMVSDALPLFFQEDWRRVRAREGTSKATLRFRGGDLIR